MTSDSGPEICVFAPSPLLTMTVEESVGGRSELHVHCGGQGFWVARMVKVLGVPVVLCGSFGGETGSVARFLAEQPGMVARGPTCSGANPAYVQNRENGERRQLLSVPAAALTRHEVDDLYNAMLAAALETSVAVLTGPPGADILAPEIYRRLASDLGANGVDVVADLSGDELHQALEGGIRMLKISVDELIDAGFADKDDEDDVLDGLRALHEAGARSALVSRGSRPALALIDGTFLAIEAPSLEAVDTHGSGDSMTAALAVALSRGLEVEEALRLAAAAGALNITRHGLGSGRRADIEQLAERVELREVGGADD
jgi:1-phosphofructokinase